MKTVRILGLGTSLYECKPNPEDGIEVWGLQYTWKSHKLHRAFLLDDREWIVQKNNTLGRNIQAEINSYDWPIYTAKLWGDLDHNVEYPLEHVLSIFPNFKHRVLKKTERGEEIDEIQGKYFLNSFCYMIALAIFEEYERIELFGCDMTNMYGRKAKDPKLEKTIDGVVYEPKGQPDETWNDERNCVNFWMGVAMGRGIEIVISRGSRITKPINEGSPTLYGYEVSDSISKIREEILKTNENLDKSFQSGKVTQSGNDTIIDMTDKKLKLSFYRKEDWPEGIKPGDVSSPKNSPYDKLD